MPFKTAVAAAATKEQPPSDVLAVLENSQSEMQLLALWQGGGERNKQSRVDQYASAVGQLLSFLRDSTAGRVVASEAELNLVAAARAAIDTGAIPKPTLLAALETCIKIRREAGAAYADRDTEGNASPEHCAHLHLVTQFTAVQAVLRRMSPVSEAPDVSVSEKDLEVDSSLCFRAVCFLLDLDEALVCVSKAWLAYKAGRCGLVRATMASNACVAFIEQQATALATHAPHMTSLQTIVAEAYMQPAIGLLEREHALSHARAVLLVVTIHDKLQRNLDLFQRVKQGAKTMEEAQQALQATIEPVSQALKCDAQKAQQVMTAVATLNQKSYSEAFAWASPRGIAGKNHPLHTARVLAHGQQAFWQATKAGTVLSTQRGAVETAWHEASNAALHAHGLSDLLMADVLPLLHQYRRRLHVPQAYHSTFPIWPLLEEYWSEPPGKDGGRVSVECVVCVHAMLASVLSVQGDFACKKVVVSSKVALSKLHSAVKGTGAGAGPGLGKMVRKKSRDTEAADFLAAVVAVLTDAPQANEQMKAAGIDDRCVFKPVCARERVCVYVIEHSDASTGART